MGYQPSFQYQNPQPETVGWRIPQDSDIGFVGVGDYANDNIICHKGASNAPLHVSIQAGDTIDLQWTAWPESHKGPVLNYLAKCSGSCETANKESLLFFKISEGGLIDGTSPPGTWVTDQMIANNNTWSLQIPQDISPGNYVLRHEIIALHSATSGGGAQNYPQCINLEISGSGTLDPSGIPATAFYKATDPGINYSIYVQQPNYPMPGPAIYNAAS
jgi:hypothetical protein